ncbi:DUF6124 family protein [Pseudomonas chlororaphis]|uniref:DUF6124 family protein n=1 Tax=Pseudomonas chlororaphis TaxID=587753 RepID=UPI0004723ED3|nr:DUF3077 domain-containing protein [Pseudomonas chlororaphis]AZC53496.1 hypothetical protein C4K35_5948 [Pseudomonas chlororaphis subsp. piscium]AZC59786.1 hypothetical protein C4K34_5656 [Pseudomonas chlororaphis subsp. piscium]AZC72193.1 hypothetical protein C4K32_5566 [Pseudomonas chlororaphis subsp. piscium]AZC78447.1 hypothetical protein C4K31_5579 [Pseudomonas chlororaphis subsp. piscium]AZC92062.1 hypothetical protein C4K29_5796 [Pseudomonas chlororaphis subsp. piscium]
MEKLVPDPPMPLPGQFRTPEHDLATQRIRLALAANNAEPSVLASLKDTAATAVGHDSLFNVRPGVSAEEALVHVSLLLDCAVQVSDEISERASGVERGLIWSMIHSVEMARAVVDSLLDANRPVAAPLGR